MQRLIEKYSHNYHRENSISSSLQLFSKEIEKLQQIYGNLENNLHPNLLSTSQLTRKLSPFQLLLNVYTALAIVRFLVFSACLRAKVQTKLYQYDLLMAAFDARRTYDQYLAACSAAFGAFVLYIYHLNYFSLNGPLVKELWRIVISTKQQIKQLQDQQQGLKLDERGNKNNENLKTRNAKKLTALQWFFKYEAQIHAILLTLFALVLFSRQKQFYRFALLKGYSSLQTVALILDGSMMIILNITLLKCAIFEEYTILLFCSEYLRAFRENTAKLLQLKANSERSMSTFSATGVNNASLFQLFRRHFELTKMVEFFNRHKVSRVMFGYIAAVLPLNIYLLQAVIFKRADSISSNYKVSVAFQTIILFTSTVPMSSIYEAIRRPARLLTSFQIAASVAAERKGKQGGKRGVLVVKFGILNFYEYLTDDASGKGFSLSTLAAIKSTNLLRFVLIYFGYIMNASLLSN